MSCVCAISGLPGAREGRKVAAQGPQRGVGKGVGKRRLTGIFFKLLATQPGQSNHQPIPQMRQLRLREGTQAVLGAIGPGSKTSPWQMRGVDQGRSVGKSLCSRLAKLLGQQVASGMSWDCLKGLFYPSNDPVMSAPALPPFDP